MSARHRRCGTHEVVAVVVAVLHPEVKLLGRTALLSRTHQGLRFQLTVLQKLVRRADVDEHVQRALRRVARLQEVRGIVLQPLGRRVRARARVQVRTKRALAPRNNGGVAVVSCSYERNAAARRACDVLEGWTHQIGANAEALLKRVGSFR